MGMPVSLHLRGDLAGRPDVETAVAAAFGELHRMDGLFSTWSATSEVSRLQRGELTLADCDPLLAEAVAVGERALRLTGGAFTTMLPDGAGGLRFDPTGLVKGWAVERAGEVLSGLPGVVWCLNAGGDVLAGRHRHVPPARDDAGPWRVGVEDPRERSRIRRVVAVAAGAVATSGTAARGPHLYDPATGEMVGRPGSVTVLGPSLLWADVWATALFVGGEATAAKFGTAAPEYTAFAL